MTTTQPDTDTILYEIDPMHSTARFTVRQFMIANVRGEFSQVTGSLRYDPHNVSRSSIETTIDAASFNSGNAKRDEHLKGPDFFDAAAFPTLTFHSTHVERRADGGLTVVGPLQMRGITTEVTLNVEGPTEEVKDVWGNQRAGVVARTRIDRTDYGLTWNAPLETGGVALSEEVDIEIELQLIRKS